MNKAPTKPSQVLFGEREVKLDLTNFLPMPIPQKYAVISFVMIIEAGNTTQKMPFSKLPTKDAHWKTTNNNDSCLANKKNSVN